MCGNSDLVEPAHRGQACGTGCTARTSGHGGRDAPWPVTGRGTLLAPGKTGWETSGGQTDPVWSSGFLTWVCVCGEGRLGRGRKPAPRADLISRETRLSYRLCSGEHGRLVYLPPMDPAGTSDLLPRLQVPASIHLCLCGPRGASPPPGCLQQ